MLATRKLGPFSSSKFLGEELDQPRMFLDEILMSKCDMSQKGRLYGYMYKHLILYLYLNYYHH
jgi:hypothetical protein